MSLRYRQTSLPCGVTKPVPLRVTLDRDGKCEIYGDLSSEHPDLGVTHSVPFVQMSDSARTRLNLCMVAKRVAVAQTS
jgi:hypothetical protein